jgi:peptidoglycan/LPS O-acetylase OafA/YrhL
MAFEQRRLTVPRDIPALTALRGLGAAAVLVFHVTAGAFGPVGYSGLGLVPRRGYLAVDLFFMLSGFVLAHVHAAEFAPGLRLQAWLRFLWARLARIYPVHLFMLLALIGFAGRPDYSAGGFIMNLLLLQAPWLSDGGGWNGVSWSISAEWHAYLAFPVIAFGIWRARGAVAAALALSCLGILACLVSSHAWAIGSITAGPLVLARTMPEFAIGALACRLCASGHLPAVFGSDVLLAAVAVNVIALATVWPSDLAILMLLPVLLLCTAANRERLQAILAARPLIFLGNISYSLYMTHFVCLDVMFFWLVPIPPGGYSDATAVAVFLAGMGVSLAVAAVVSRFVEWPARAYMRGSSRLLVLRSDAEKRAS